jgi:hypothetical protein
MSDILNMNESLNIGDSLTSPNQEFLLLMQTDGNLVVYHGPPTTTANAIWSTNTYTLPPDEKPTYLAMQSDGNIALYGVDRRTIRWQSGTWGPDFVKPFLMMQDDGNLVVYYANSQPIWATGRYPDKVGEIPGRGYVDAPRSPISIPLTSQDLGNSHYIQTAVSMDFAGRVTGHTVLTCTNKIIGFTANIGLAFFDENGRRLGSFSGPSWGCNQAPLIGANHRIIDWPDPNAPLMAPPGTTKIGLVQYWAPKERWPGVVQIVDDAINAIDTALNWIGQFCDRCPDCCSFTFYYEGDADDSDA